MAKSPESPVDAAAAKALAAEMAEEVRQALNDYSATVPHPEFAELGYAVRMRNVRKGVVHRARLTLLLERRTALPEYRTLAGASRTEADLLKETSVAPKPNCPRCQGTGWTSCPECDHLPSQSKADSNCPRCGGTGEAGCRACHGSGTTTHRNGKWTVRRKCTKCLGSGQAPCEFCRKRGGAVCRRCGGKARLHCACVEQARPSQTRALEVPAALAGVDIWAAERPTVMGWEPFSENWRWDDEEEATVACPACQRRGKVPCSRCQGAAGSSCPVCGGKGQIACKACDGKGELLARLNVSRKLEPLVLLRYLSALPCPQDAFQDWEQPGDFESECDARLEGPPDPAFWPALPDHVMRELLAWTEEATGSAEEHSVRIVRHHLEVASSRAIYATYTFNDSEYDCWLLGSSRRLLAPSNPITERLDADLATIHEYVESGDLSGATELLSRCRAMGKADPYCQKRLDEAEAEIHEQEGGTSGRTWLILGAVTLSVAVLAFLAYQFLT